LIPVFHAAGCGGLAFNFVTEPREGMPLEPELVAYPDGSVPPRDTMAICWTCSQPLEVTELTTRMPRPRE
jgi:hypothetical protein